MSLRLCLIAEGHSEVSFAGGVLAPSLWHAGIYLEPRLLGPVGKKGGNPAYGRVKREVVIQLQQDRNSCCITMLDYYGLGDGFPGTPIPPGLSPLQAVVRIEQAFKAAVIEEYPDLRADRRFIPYLQLHEFEALLFSDPAAFAQSLGQPWIETSLQRIRDQFPTPEDIDHGRETTPSKRIQKLYPRYRKPVDGRRAADAVGLEKMREQCPHFRDWLEEIERLAVL